MMKAGWIFTTLLAVSLSATGFAQQPKVGERAPEIALEKVVSPQSALAVTMAGLRGKVVVMEFWGLWCGYCKQSIPHLNQLADKFGPRGVEFISTSSDHEKYTYELTVEGKGEESLRKAVREQLGLDLRKERRTLPVVVVRKT
jgi:thiol-disulfide isomerase/thioredoxin